MLSWIALFRPPPRPNPAVRDCTSRFPILVVVDRPSLDGLPAIFADCGLGFQSLLSWIALFDRDVAAVTEEIRQVSTCCRGSPSSTKSGPDFPLTPMVFQSCCRGSSSTFAAIVAGFQSVEFQSVVVDRLLTSLLEVPRGICSGFNPCCRGSPSSTAPGGKPGRPPHRVSILVVVDRPLRPCHAANSLTGVPSERLGFNPRCRGSPSSTWTRKRSLSFSRRSWCFNPCCRGSPSSTTTKTGRNFLPDSVLPE